MNQRADQDILQAIYERHESLEEYATRHGMSKDEASDLLALALKRQKSRLTNDHDCTRLPAGMTHLRTPSQKERRIRRSLDPDFDCDVDEWGPNK